MTKLRDGTVTFSGPVRLMVVMKKLLLIGMLLLLLPVCPSEARGVNKTRLAAVVRQYNAEPDFEVVPVGGLLMSIVRGMVRKEIDTTGDDDARRAIQLLDGLRKVVVIDYSNCEDNVKQHFNRDVAKVLKKADCLMEAKDLVEGAPKIVKEQASKGEADDLKAKLEEQGAKVTLK